MEFLTRVWFWTRSLPKSDWRLEDYPIRIRRTEPSGFIAQIVGWWVMSGVGDTPEEARESLRANLEARRSSAGLKRPGTVVPPEFAGSPRIDGYGDFAYDLVEEVTGIRPFFMSDQSSFGDFATEEDDEDKFRAKILSLYGVDIEGLLECTVVDVADRVRAGL